MRRAPRFSLSLVVLLAACGGRIAGETDPLERRVTGTKTGEPSAPTDPDAPGVLTPTPAEPSSPPSPGSSSKPPMFPWAGSCSAIHGPSSPPRPAPSEADDPVYLATLRRDAAGHWRGVVATPWEPVYEVFVAFEADGHYASRSLHANLPAFYYGTDFDTDLKKWSLTGVTPSGVASGAIDIAFQYGSTFGLPTWTGKLHDVTLDSASRQFSLSFTTSDGHGPVHFELWRCPN
jgi:hypothetical protein